MENAHISKLRIYPIKSLGYIELEEAEIGTHSLMNDRLFAMIDEDGRYINGKRTGRVNQLMTEFDLASGLVWFADRQEGERKSFDLHEGNKALDNYLSEFFDVKLKLIKNDQGKLMDIPVKSSVTIVSEASLQSLQTDIERHTLKSMRLRFRSNVELAGVDAFWEERLYQEPGSGVRFRIGDVEMIGISPRARCNVPPQDPNTGKMDYHFVKNMVESRNKDLAIANDLLQYGRASYFLAINVYVAETQIGKKIKLNDKIEILETVNLTS